MTLIKKVDVTAYRAARRRSGLHLVKNPDKASETQSPKNGQPVEVNHTAFDDDFSLDHSAPGGTLSAKVFPETSSESHAASAPGAKHS